jgi:hypothetical protein
VNKEPTGNDDVVSKVDNVFKAVSVKPRNELFNTCRPRQGAVGGVDDDRQGHEPKGFLEFELFDKDDCEKRDDGTESRIEVYQPGERQLVRHSPDLSRRGSKAWASFQAGDPGVNIFVLRVNLNLDSIEGIDIWNKCDVAKTETASQIFAAFELFFKSIEAFGNFGPRLLNDLGISFCLGFTELAVELPTSRIEVTVS